MPWRSSPWTRSLRASGSTTSSPGRSRASRRAMSTGSCGRARFGSTESGSGRMPGSRPATPCAFRRSGPRRPPAPRASGAARQRCRSFTRTTHLLAVDKPAGLAVHGGSGIAHGLIESLRAARPEARFLELVHRLDRDTSGVLLIAKRRAALVELHRMLRDGEIDKRYLVLVRGRWRDEKRDGPATAAQVLDARGRAARPRRRRHGPRSGHDVPAPASLARPRSAARAARGGAADRAHASDPRAPDASGISARRRRQVRRLRVEPAAGASEGLKRMFLHAARLSFVHPATGEPMALESPLPPDLAAYRARARRAAECR